MLNSDINSDYFRVKFLNIFIEIRTPIFFYDFCKNCIVGTIIINYVLAER